MYLNEENRIRENLTGKSKQFLTDVVIQLTKLNNLTEADVMTSIRSAKLSENIRKNNQIELRQVCSCCGESVEYLYGDEQICYDCMTIEFFEED